MKVQTIPGHTGMDVLEISVCSVPVTSPDVILN